MIPATSIDQGSSAHAGMAQAAIDPAHSAGRSCPLRYRYGAAAIASAPLSEASILYVIGGLYGNLPALDAIEAMARAESGPVTLCFNGDFNWFNVDASSFAAINQRVLQHRAIVGNVEAELLAGSAEAGCGCAYPACVADAVVERSNRIHARLKATADSFPALQAQLASLPMFARFQVGSCRVGVVHGDADALAGWGFDVAALEPAQNQPWLVDSLARAQVDVFASTHTCQPALKRVAQVSGHAADPGTSAGIIINNGAAGMPNFPAERGLFGLITRIAISPSPHTPVYGARQREVFVDALPVYYAQQAWQVQFLRNWPPGSDAWLSYFARISLGCGSSPRL